VSTVAGIFAEPPQDDAHKSLDFTEVTPPDRPVTFKLPQDHSNASRTHDIVVGPLCTPVSQETPLDAIVASKPTDGGIVDKEGKSVGRVGWEIYWFYFKACGGVRAVVGIVGGTALCSLAW
jgi:hypothetical protein